MHVSGWQSRLGAAALIAGNLAIDDRRLTVKRSAVCAWAARRQFREHLFAAVTNLQEPRVWYEDAGHDFPPNPFDRNPFNMMSTLRLGRSCTVQESSLWRIC